MPIPKIITSLILAGAYVGLGMTQRIKGPRLDNLKTTTAEYGTPISRFWGKRKFEVPIIWAADLREKKKTSKGKGGKQTNYNYFADFAFLICDHPIEAVTRVWFDDKLVYDATSTGPISMGAIIAGALGLTGDQNYFYTNRNFRIYLGTEDQEADPLMEAWCEDRYGPDSCPAYKGSAYAVIENLPVNNYGNRIPNITVEAVSVKSDQYLYDDVLNAGADWNTPAISKGASRLLIGDETDFRIWDVASREVVRSGALPGWINGTGTTSRWTIDSSGNIWATASAITPFNEWYLYQWNGDGTALQHTYDVTDADGTFYSLTFLQTLSGATSDYILMTGEDDAFGISTGSAPVIYFPSDISGAAWVPRFGALDHEGNPWVIGSTGSTVTFYNVAAATYFTASLTGTPSGQFAAYHYADNDVDHFLLFTSLGTFLVERTGAHTVTGPTAFSGADIEKVLRVVPSGRSSLFFSNNTSQILEYSCVDGSLIRALNTSSWVSSSVGSDNGIYDPVSHAWLVYDAFLGASPGLRWYFLDRIDAGPVTLADIVDDVSGWCGLTGQDTSALTQEINGYSVTQGSGKDMLDPLLTIHDVDARPHDFSVQFLVRGSSASGTLLTEDFVREGDASRYSIAIAQDTDLPKEVTVNYADIEHDQATNTAVSQRVADAMDSSRAETIDLSTYATTADEAQQLSDRRLRRIWNEREHISLGLTAQYLALEPGDVRTVSVDGEPRPARLDKLTIRQSSLDCEWVRSEPSLHTLNGATGAAMEGRDPDVIFIPPLSKGVVMDIPLITDSHNDVNPLIYYAAAGYTDPFVGAFLLRGDDGTYDEEAGAVEADAEATIGYATDVLDTANPNLWDRGNSVNISMVNGTLTSSTEAAIDADPTVNMAAIGADGRWEIVNFTTATLEADGTYGLSGFKRGRRGTEGNVDNHEIGDEFVLLSGALRAELGSDDVGDDLSFKAVSAGRSEESAVPIDLAFTGATLKPYAPARLEWTTDGTDLFGEITRRTRVGGSWSDDGVVPLSENSEAYEVDVLDGSGDVIDTIEVTGTNTFTITAADLATYSASVSAPPDVNVYQMSDAVGRGFALAA